MNVLQARRDSTDIKLAALRVDLARAAEIAGEAACICVTGSYGRREASVYSDLDSFVMTNLSEEDHSAWVDRSRAALVAELHAVKGRHGFEDSPGTAEYDSIHSVEALVNTLGRSDDDKRNTLTARILLLAESRALTGNTAYAAVIDRVIAAYWRDFEGHETEFVPGFLTNDVLRMWRTFCVNYEARTKSDPPEMKAKRFLKNYKLKHSRLLTCYSLLAHLLVLFGANRTVTPSDMRSIAALSPTERLQWIAKTEASVAPLVERILFQYAQFLRETDAPSDVLVERLLRKEERQRLQRDANALGEAVFDLIERAGGRTELHRQIVV